MRRVLFAAVAAAPLCAILNSPAAAETVITTAVTTPVRTSTAANGAPDDVRVASGGSVRPTSGVAVTLDSNNTVVNEGTISITGADDAVGIEVQGGRTGAVTNRGTIAVNEDFTPTDADNDGDIDGPFAQGRDRFGIRVTGTSPFVGNITQEAAGRIQVEGNDSAGVRIQPSLTGALLLNGGIEVLGDRSIGVHTSGPISGNVTIGTVSARGRDSSGVLVGGPVSGGLTFNNSIIASGYRFIARPGDVSKLDADDLLQGGPAVHIAASVAGGVIVDAPPPDRSPTDTDEDKDGVPDAQETTGAITSLGAAPGLLIGATGSVASPAPDLNIGATAGAGAGLLIRGRVAGTGIYDGVSSIGVQIGANRGIGGSGSINAVPGATNIANGIRVTGQVLAEAAGTTASPASATAMRINERATTPLISFEGTAGAAVTGVTTGAARTLLIEQGASVATFRNSGTTDALVAGPTGDAIVVQDLSGTLTLVENTGRLAARHAPTAANPGPVTGRNIAFDLSANTSGATVRQSGVNDGDDGGDNIADPDADADGVDDADEPSILGDVLFGSGADRLEVLNGSVLGSVAFGAGADTLLIDGGARVAGAVTDSDGQLAIDIRRGSLELSGGQTLRAASLAVGAQSTLIVTLDPQNTAAVLDIAGPATFTSGSRLGVRLTTLLQQPTQFTLLRANSLSATGLNADISQDTPFLFVSSVSVNQAAGTITANVRRRTAAEAGLNRPQGDAFEAVYAVLGEDAALRDAFLRQTTREGFLGLYEQTLPEHTGGALYSLSAGSEALSRALRDRSAAQATGRNGAWLQEVGFRISREEGEDTGFDAGGFGVMGGVERPGFGGALGVSAALLASDIDEGSAAVGEQLSFSLLEAGLYWRGDFGPLTTALRGSVGRASLNSDRRLISEADSLLRTAQAEWNGLTGAIHAGAAYRADFGRFFLRPEASFDAVMLREGEYQEKGGGAAFDLTVDERTSRLAAATGMVTLGARFGRDVWVAPEISGGWRQIISGGPGETTARFGSAGAPFTMRPADAPGGAAVVALGVTGGSAYSVVSLQARGEVGDDYNAADIRLNVKFLF
jgi:outer membrane autotransporter protein